jgi:hypothetical protein
MCIITDKVEKVSNTQIFAALVGPRTQLTVYSNKVHLDNQSGEKNPYNWPSMFNSTPFGVGHKPAGGLWWEDEIQGRYAQYPGTDISLYQQESVEKPVAMVLAVPLINGDADSIKMIDMGKEPKFFEELEEAFPKLKGRSSDSRSFSLGAQSKGESFLKVKRCGSYSYSIVPDVESFERLKQDVFKVNPRVFSLLRKHYPRGYAFLVCIIDKSADYSPIAYIHPSDGKRLFIPALHEHGHAGEELVTDDWDHAIYSLDADSALTPLTDGRLLSAKVKGAVYPPEFTGSFPYKNLNWDKLKKRIVKGLNPNGDILLKL